jgi:hypothetical protein
MGAGWDGMVARVAPGHQKNPSVARILSFVCMKNPLCRALLQREVTLGSWVQIGQPAEAEVLARAER